MPKRLIYKLKIDAYSPDSIPMKRLAEYMSDLAALLGEPDSVHFLELEAGSTVVSALVETEAIPKVSSRIQEVEKDDAPKELRKTYDSLDKRLASDNATGNLTAVADDLQEAQMIRFPGIERPRPLDYGPVREYGTLDGIPISITGRDKTKHIQLSDHGSIHTGISMSEALAIRIMDEQCVYRKVIRLRGVGRWLRDENGEWQVESFRVEDFEILESNPLRETIEKIRSMPSDWDEIDDPASFLRDLTEDPDERLH